MKMIGIVGSRARDYQTDYDLVEGIFFEKYKKGDIIVSGGAKKGADAFAKEIARRYKIPYLEFPADWAGENPFNDWTYNRGAGHIRNTDIAQHSDYLIVCLKEWGGGAFDTLKKALKLRKKCYIFIGSSLVAFDDYEDLMKHINGSEK